VTEQRWLIKRVLIRKPGDIEGFYLGPDCFIDAEIAALIENPSVFGQPPAEEEAQPESAKAVERKATLARKKKEASVKRRKNAEARSLAAQKAATIAGKKAAAIAAIDRGTDD